MIFYPGVVRLVISKTLFDLETLFGIIQFCIYVDIAYLKGRESNVHTIDPG